MTDHTPLTSRPGGDELASQFERQLRAMIKADRVTLGSVPTVIARISSAARQPEITADALAAEVAADPVLTARLMRVANSSLYAGRSPATKLPLAIARLGLPVSCKLVLALALAQAVKPAHAQLRGRLARQWTRSIEVAALSRVIAEHYSVVDPDEAFLAGLFHRIGVLPIINLADQMPGMAIRLDILDKSIEAWRARLGTWLLNSWHFPPAMVAVPAQVQDLKREHAGPADLGDVVTVAMLQSDETLIAADPLLIEHVPAWHKLGLETTLGVLLGANIAERISEARSLFE